jgi:predicted phage tail protein
MQQTVRLLDDLGERYGSEHAYFNLRSPAEAIKLLCINHPALQKELAEAHQHGVGYTLVQAGTFLGYDDLRLPLGKNDLVLAPVIAGSGSNATPILIGAALVAVAIVAAPLSAGFLGAGVGIGATAAPLAAAGGGFIAGTGGFIIPGVSVALGSIGTSLVLGGVAGLLAPQPEPFKDVRARPGENTNASGPQGVSRATSGQQSYAFTGPANTVGVGATVPLVYGKLLIGSHLLSSRVDVANESDPTGQYFSLTGARSVTINSVKPGNKFKALNGLRTRTWSHSDVRLANQSGHTALKTTPNDVIRFDQTDNVRSDEVQSLEAEDSTRRQNLQILFEIEGGLFNVIGGQMVPAFVTYEIKISKDDYPGDDPVAATVRGTIQGLLKKTDPYKFAHAITYATLGEEDSDTTVELNIRIIDTDAEESGGRLIVRGYGYNHFVNDGENNTEALTEL